MKNLIFVAMMLCISHPISPMKRKNKPRFSQTSALARPLLATTQIDEDNHSEPKQPEPLYPFLSNDDVQNSTCLQNTEQDQISLPSHLDHPMQKSASTYWEDSIGEEKRPVSLLVHAAATASTTHDVSYQSDDEDQQPSHQSSIAQLHEKITQRLQNIPSKVEVEWLLSINYKPQRCINTIFTNFDILTLALYQNGLGIAISGSRDHKHLLLIYDLDHGTAYKKIKCLQSSHPIHFLTFCPTSRKLLFACSYLDQNNYRKRTFARVLKFDEESHEVITELDGFEDHLHRKDFSCGWLNDETIVACENNIPVARWHISSEPSAQ